MRVRGQVTGHDMPTSALKCAAPTPSAEKEKQYQNYDYYGSNAAQTTIPEPATIIPVATTSEQKHKN